MATRTAKRGQPAKVAGAPAKEPKAKASPAAGDIRAGTVEREIDLEKLVIGKGQVRTHDVGKEINELADSIAAMGLMHPIIVAPADKNKFEILTGQRRFLAHKQLKRKTIRALVLPKSVDLVRAKSISLTENLVRRDPNNIDLIDACTVLYKHYGSIKDVSDALGLPYQKVQQLVKYERLRPEMRKLVDKGDVKLKMALKAQDAASVGGKFNAAEAIKLAKEMASMSGAQAAKMVKTREEQPTLAVDELIEASKSGGKITQVIVTLTADVHSSLQAFAKDEETTQDDAAASLITDGLTSKGFLEN